MTYLWVAAVFGLHSYVTYLAWVSVVLWLWVCTLGASENERTRISEPHGNTHLRPSHNDPH